MNQAVLQKYCQDSIKLQHSRLFEMVQLEQLFADGKTFVDATAKADIDDILARFKGYQGPLSAFVSQYFELPDDNEVLLERQGDSVIEHIELLWSQLKRPADDVQPNSLLPLPQPYIIPGGRFREIYYWDSYFTALGLIDTPQQSLIEGMLDNFISLQQHYGIIPNGNRSYYLTRSQPPVLALICELLLRDRKKDLVFVKKCVVAMEREYQFWMSGKEHLSENNQCCRRVVRMNDGALLNRYWDSSDKPRAESYREDLALAVNVPSTARGEFFRHIRAACESGWDFSSRWLDKVDELASIRTTDLVPVDLNCLLYQLETQLGRCYLQLGNHSKACFYQACGQQRKVAINRFLWSAERSFYCDYNHRQSRQSQVLSLAGIVPMFVGIATEQQAKSCAAIIQSTFLKPGGLVTTDRHTAQQWDSPNGWAPLHWFAIVGLQQYGQGQLAQQICERWLNTVETFFAKTGKLMEKYDVCSPSAVATGGEYDVQEGFGWTNGVTAALYRMKVSLS